MPALAMIGVCTALTVCAHAWAAHASTVPLHYGSNQLSFGPDTGAGMAVLAYRDNFNAHGFDVLTMYIKPAAASDSGDWQLVSIFDGGKEALLLTSGGGADCTLHDFRLVREAAGKPLRLIVARRDPGASYADAAVVHFSHYALRHNGGGEVGFPLYYFALERESVAKAPYCDVGEAFEKELGIAPYRRR
jgi:hypothetical protein